jgi:catechol 2,3-dioxygenase-like lactoylglutathione lyase family enzyme
MLDHLGVNVRDIESSKVFYDRLLAPIGVKATALAGGCVGYGHDRPFFWLEPVDSRHNPTGGAHVAFVASQRGQVLAAKAAAEMLGAQVVHQPEVIGDYHPSYFAVFVLDPDGNSVEIVCHRDRRENPSGPWPNQERRKPPAV